MMETDFRLRDIASIKHSGFGNSSDGLEAREFRAEIRNHTGWQCSRYRTRLFILFQRFLQPKTDRIHLQGAGGEVDQELGGTHHVTEIKQVCLFVYEQLLQPST